MIGTTVSQYRVIENLGGGGMAARLLVLIALLQQSSVLVGQRDTVRVGVELVVVPVSVRDSKGKLIPDLKKEDFRIRQDGRIQESHGLIADSMPLSALVLADSSR
jgi:hypothetical protein